METTNDELMGRMKVSRAVSKMAVPSVISSLVTVIYNMADTFFVGQTGDSLQVAAVSLTNPIFILLMAAANMLGMGGSAVASMALGRKEDRVRQPQPLPQMRRICRVGGDAPAISLRMGDDHAICSRIQTVFLAEIREKLDCRFIGALRYGFRICRVRNSKVRSGCIGDASRLAHLHTDMRIVC